MKTTTLIIILLPLFISAQTTTPDVITSSGAYFSNTNGSLSWTLGELATETFSNGGNTLTQGFQQPVSVSITGVNLDLLVYLEGPFNGTEMNTDLTGLPDPVDGFPLSQPYNTSPWNYAGTESVSSIPNSNVVDWVLIELRDAASASAALPADIIGTQAAFLLKDGSVVGTDGSSILYYNVTVNHDLFVVIWHRNHLGVLSANALSQTGGVFNYDFSSAVTQVYNGGAGYKEIATGKYGMVAGDANGSGELNTSDHNLWKTNAGKKGYLSSDYDMDAQANNPDKNDYYIPNINYESQIPD
ncbi:MAG: hypothetical protein DRJ05_08780 [Bacteroidetes bacterium]|nr:MAG: hypothetical protein DRJ05_08780 [Bacteroidota bacterium]